LPLVDSSGNTTTLALVAKVLKGKRQLKRKANTTKRKATLNCSADFTLTRTKQRTTLSSINVRNEEEREGNNNKLLGVGKRQKAIWK
jgi:hypothetical protein